MTDRYFTTSLLIRISSTKNVEESAIEDVMTVEA